jgi:F0F1-type ATP synthase assembly protein I
MAGSRNSAADVLTVVVLDIAAIGIGALVGWLLDKVAESAPLLLLFGAVIGLVVASVLSWSRLRGSAYEQRP